MDRKTFTGAVEKYQDMVYRVALNALRSRQDAEDAVQEVFLRLFNRTEDFSGEEHLKRWLLRVSVNYCRDVLKSPWKRVLPLNGTLPAPPRFREENQSALYSEVVNYPPPKGGGLATTRKCKHC